MASEGKFTWDTRASLLNLKAEDDTNLTEVNRGVRKYVEILGLKGEGSPGNTTASFLGRYICALKESLGRKVRIVDSGCGACVAINQLLSDGSLNGVIEDITGISVHYFENIYKVMTAHKHLFIFYLGKAQEILLTNDHLEAYDLIFDTCGAFLYSEDKLNVLHCYYNSLRIGGRALVHISSESLLYTNDEGEILPLMDLMIQRYSDIFSFAPVHFDKKFGLCMTKTSSPWPFPPYTIISSRQRPVFNNPDPHSPAVFETGNAMSYDRVCISFTK